MMGASLFLLLVASACRFDGSTANQRESDSGPDPDGTSVDAAADLDATSSFDATSSLDAAPSARVTDDLIVLYTFDSVTPGEIADVSGFGTPLDLAVAGAGQYETTAAGWRLTGETLIRSKTPATKIITECSSTNAITLEAWIRPTQTEQTGPARILSMGGSPTDYNFVVGQGGQNGVAESRFAVRLRTASTTASPPSTLSALDAVTTEWTHLLFARGADESFSFYLNGQKQDLFDAALTAPLTSFPGALDNWDSSFTLNLGNEVDSNDTVNRFWLGEYAMVAIYRRDLNAAEVSQNFLAGY